MKKNLGAADRLACLILAVILGIAAFLSDSAMLRIILGLLSLFILYEALASWCILYFLIGRNTCPVSYQPARNRGKKRIVIVGAGPGGLSAGMILASRGFEVLILEKEERAGGRNAPLKIGDYTFEIGPTFIMLPQVFKEVFALAGRKLEDYLDFRRIDPLYRLRFSDGRDFYVHGDKEKMKAEIAGLFPGEEEGYEIWFKKHRKKFERTYACLEVPYIRFYNYLRWKLLRALPVMQLHRSVNGVLEKYFKTKEMVMSTGFQAKYIGMSPWECPGAFSILSYAEHGYGIYHSIGGIHKISDAMAKIIGEYGGKIEYGAAVKEVLAGSGKAAGVLLLDGRKIEADAVVINADFSYAMKNLVKEDARPSYTDQKLDKMKYSCSTFMLYLGLDKKYDIPHHNIFFGDDYRKNVEQIFDGSGMPDNPAFYIQNASVIDTTLAPQGKSAIYVLVPVSNLSKDFPWKERKNEFRDMIIKLIKERSELKDIEDHIEVQKIVTPQDWQDDYNIFRGAVFNLAHNIGQMLYLRPHNRYNDIENLYLVGGGTHPGSGLPTILESGRIAADLISKKAD